MIPVFKPSIRRKEMDSVLSSLVSDEIGPMNVQKELVKDLCRIIEAAGGFALREYERAFSLVLEALELEAGDGVVLSALDPTSAYKCIERLGLKPLPVDVEETCPCIDPRLVQKKVEEGAKAVLSTGRLGFVPALDRISELGVPLIEEISTTLGGHTGVGASGSFGEQVILRLETDDLVTAGGGTVVLSKGRGDFVKLKKAAEALPREAFLPDMNAALAKIQLKELDRYFERRREIYAHLLHALQTGGRHGFPTQEGEGEAVAFSFPVLVEGGVKDVQGYARKKGVETKRAFEDSVLALFDPIASREENGFPRARNFLNRCLLFPLYPRMAKDQVEQIAKVLSTLP